MALILLVEDEKLLRWGFRRRLEHHGHLVHEAVLEYGATVSGCDGLAARAHSKAFFKGGRVLGPPGSL